MKRKMLKKIRKNEEAAITIGLIALVVIIGGFLFMSFLLTQIVNIGYAILLVGIGVLAVGGGAVLLRKGLSGMGIGKAMSGVRKPPN